MRRVFIIILAAIVAFPAQAQDRGSAVSRSMDYMGTSHRYFRGLD